MLQTLIVERVWVSAYNQQTILRGQDGKTKAIISNSLRQPKRTQKSIVINCNTFLLNWDNVPKISSYVKIKDRV